MHLKVFEEKKKNAIPISLNGFKASYKGFKGKTVTIKECPILITTRAITDDYFIQINPVRGIRICYRTVENEETAKYINISGRLIEGINEGRGIKNESHDLILPHYSILPKIIDEFCYNTKKAVSYYENLLVHANTKLKFLEDIVQKYPELVI